MTTSCGKVPEASLTLQEMRRILAPIVLSDTTLFLLLPSFSPFLLRTLRTGPLIDLGMKINPISQKPRHVSAETLRQEFVSRQPFVARRNRTPGSGASINFDMKKILMLFHRTTRTTKSLDAFRLAFASRQAFVSPRHGMPADMCVVCRCEGFLRGARYSGFSSGRTCSASFGCTAKDQV